MIITTTSTRKASSNGWWPSSRHTQSGVNICNGASCCSTYPLYSCYNIYKYRRLDKGDADLVGIKPFYDWILDRPTRAVYMFMDNAPYHRGVAYQLQDKSKDAIAALLRAKGVTEIEFSHIGPSGQPVTGHAEVPPDGKSFARNFPNKEQLIEGALKAFKALDEQLDVPPWQRLLDSVKDKWGRGDSIDGWNVSFTPPYLPKQIAVELKWADGENFVGNAENQSERRSTATVIELLRKRWYSGVTSGAKLFSHCEKEMEKMAYS